MGEKVTFKLTTVTEYTVDSDWYNGIEEDQKIIEIENSILKDDFDIVLDILSENSVDIQLEEVLK